MEADQNQEVPAAERPVAEMEGPVCEGEGPTPEPKEPVENASDPQENASSMAATGAEALATPETLPEKLEAGVPEEALEKPSDLGKPAEQKPEGEVELQKNPESTEQPADEPKVEQEQNVEPSANPEPNPNPSANPEPNPNPSANPEPNPNPSANPEPNPNPSANPEPNPNPSANPEPNPNPSADAAGPTEAAKEAEPVAKAPEAKPEKPSEVEENKVEESKEAAPESKEAAPESKEAAPESKEAAIPLFFGWFLLSDVEEKMKCSTMEFLKTLDTLQAFKKHLTEFTGEDEKEVDLEQYFQTKMPLHCTAKFCDYGKAEGAKEYMEQQVVKDAQDAASELAVVGLMVTPRTFGARVALTPEQLQLWPPGADTEGVPTSALPSAEALPVGSRAHVTLGCAAGVEAVQTGLDLLEVLALQQTGHQASTSEELDAGTLSYLGEGRWYLQLQEPIACDVTFSSFSEDVRPAEPAKKEGGEKKKKPKCSIL